MPAPRVLIVDDARFMRMMLCDLLSKNGLEVVGQAANGLEAVETYKQIRPDLVTLDIMMPGSDGLKALKEILAEDPQARVVIVSAVEHSKIIDEAMRLGAKNYIVKPFSPNRIVELLKQAAGLPAEDQS